MTLFARKFVACFVFLAIVFTSNVCFCASTNHGSSQVNMGPDCPMHRHQNDGDRGQDSSRHETCHCLSNLVSITDSTQVPGLKPVMEWPSLVAIMPLWSHCVVFESYVPGWIASTLPPHAPYAETTLLRLHCALMV